MEDWLASSARLRWTDDTHMALTLAQVLRDANGTLETQQLGDAFAAAYAVEPWRGYGAGPPQVFALASRGMTYVEAAGSLFGRSGSFGNGAAELAGDDLAAVALRIGTGVAARESVPAAVAALLDGEDVASTLVAAVRLGGDTDTIAAMAGAMAGAAYGASTIPDRLLARLEALDELEALATALGAS